MPTFRQNNNRRGRFRSNDRNFRRNGDSPKFKSDFSPNSNFQRKVPGRNNHNAPKLIEKYTDLAKEALSKEDKVLSENYFQHAEHFIRVLSEQEKLKELKINNNQNSNKIEVVSDNSKKEEEAEKKDTAKI
tara:strand:+ start:42 stop:434 length:393 start_codon:yes stop_codon:yes gene_type:complete